jgi:hypothetical protein
LAGIENIATTPSSVEVMGEESLPEFEIDIDELDETEDLEAEEAPEIEHFDNLVKYIDPDELNKIGQQVIEGMQADEESRQEWVDTVENGLKMLGLKIEELNEPFEGACGAFHPLILESAVKFQSKASLELFPAEGPVKTQIVGKSSAEKEEKASRIKNFLNYQITEKIPEYYTEGERLLFASAIMGTVFRKISYSQAKDRPVAQFVTYKNFVVADTAKDLHEQSRYTHIIPTSSNELLRSFANGEYIEPEDAISPSNSEEMDAMAEIKGFIRPQDDRSRVYSILEQHVNINLPEPFNNRYDIADPYIVVVDRDSGKVLSITRNWAPDKDNELNREKDCWFVPWHFVPGMGFHSFGYIHLLGNLQLTLTTVLRSLVDSGTFANLQGGFKLKGVKISGDLSPISPGEFRDVEATVDDLNKAIKTLPFKEPSTVLYHMLEFIEARSQKFADTTEQIVSDATNYGPVGTTMALLEAGAKFYNAIHKRMHFSQKQELRILSRVYAKNVINTGYDYDEEGSFDEDFGDRVDILPVSDPNIPSAAHRMTLANTALDIALKVPQIANQREAVRAALKAMGNIDVDRIIPPEEAATELDPVSDIEAAVIGKPIRAFSGQDHQSHIKIKSLWLEDPSNGGSPVMQAASPAIMANIREHMMLAYREQLAGQVSNLPPEALEGANTEEYVISLAAEQAAKLNEALAEQMNEPDPLAKIAEAEMLRAQTQKEKLEHDKKIDFADTALDAQRLGLEMVKEQNRHNEKAAVLAGDTRKANFGAGRDLIKLSLEQLARNSVDKSRKSN